MNLNITETEYETLVYISNKLNNRKICEYLKSFLSIQDRLFNFEHPDDVYIQIIENNRTYTLQQAETVLLTCINQFNNVLNTKRYLVEIMYHIRSLRTFKLQMESPLTFNLYKNKCSYIIKKGNNNGLLCENNVKSFGWKCSKHRIY